MKLRELVEKIDNDIVLWIVRAPDTNVLFKRENASDVIPESLLCMEVGTFFPGYGRLHIEVKRNAGKGSKFQVGDRVYAPFHKYGTIVEIVDTDASYPITVRWDESRYKLGGDLSTFTEDGYLFFGDKTENTKITKIEGGKMGQISGVIDHNIAKKMTEDSEKVSTDNEIFHVGDRVHTLFNGYGTIIGTHGADRDYPILVKWDIDTNNLTEEVSTYTVDGEYYARNHDPASALTVVKDESTIERMEDALSKKVEDAVNPAHYKVEGLPEAYDIMTHLMNREQLEGFLWGNIIKYAYRYGRKGDEAETAGKIKWYAQKLKELRGV